MDIIVTGGSGFVGQELIKWLAAMHHNVANIDMVPSNLYIDEIIHDLTTGPVSVEADFCFHLASATGGLLFNQQSDVIEYNAELNKNTLLSCEDMPIVFVSTLNVFVPAILIIPVKLLIVCDGADESSFAYSLEPVNATLESVTLYSLVLC